MAKSEYCGNQRGQRYLFCKKRINKVTIYQQKRPKPQHLQAIQAIYAREAAPVLVFGGGSVSASPPL